MLTDCTHASISDLAGRKEEGNGAVPGEPHLVPSSPCENRPREFTDRRCRSIDRKTSLRPADGSARPPTGPAQAAAAAALPACFALEHTTQHPAAQHATKTLSRAGRTAATQHVAAWPVARPLRIGHAFFDYALTLAAHIATAGNSSCSRHRRGRAYRWRRWRPVPTTLPITLCLLLAMLTAVAAGPVVLLRTPASPAPCRRSARDRTIAASRMGWPKPLSTTLEQTTALPPPAWPLRSADAARQ